MFLDNDDFRILGRLTGTLERNVVFKILKGPKLENIINNLEKMNLGFLTVNQKLCVNNRHKDEFCDTCMEYCPVDAIEFNSDDGIRIDVDRCLKCGICDPMCPCGVFEAKEPSNGKLIFQLNNILKRSEKNKIIFKCTKIDGMYGKIENKRINDNTISLPCLGRLPEILILIPHLYGVNEIVFDGCDNNCVCSEGKEAFKVTLNYAKHLIKYLGLENNRSSMTEKSMNDNISTFLPENDLDRREFFNEIIKKSGKIWDIENEKPAENVDYWHQEVPWGRKLLLKITEKSDKHEYIVKREDLPFAELDIINERCDVCETCSKLCPTGALNAVDLEDIAILYFNFAKCVGCGLCTKVCPNDAINMKGDIDLGNITGNARVLVKKIYEQCSSCGQAYINISMSQDCPHCSRTEFFQNALQNSINKT